MCRKFATDMFLGDVELDWVYTPLNILVLFTTQDLHLMSTLYT